MNLTTLLADKDMSASEKLTKVAEVVAKARKAYGNPDVKIKVPSVPSTEGQQELTYLSDADKVAVARTEVAKIKVAAIETTKCTKGAVLDRELERLISVNPVLVNLDVESGSEYI